MLDQLLRKNVPLGFLKKAHRLFWGWLKPLKKPRMLWGYKDSTGSWRPQTRISDTSLLIQPKNIHIADKVFVWHYTILDGSGGLYIGEGSQIGAWVGLFTHSSHIAIRLYGNHYTEVSDKIAFQIKPITIGRFVFVGAGARVLPGVTIGDGALIASGALVTKDIPAFKIASGSPAKIQGDVHEIDRQYLDSPEIEKWYYEWQERV